MASNFEFSIGSARFVLSDLGYPMNGEIMNFYESKLSNKAIDLVKFKNMVNQFLTSLNQNDFHLHDAFFSNFTIIWSNYLVSRQFELAEDLWNFLLQIVYEWETAAKKHVHKGTPYYFLGVTYLLNKDLERGFLLMHQAFEEDKLISNTYPPLTPAYYFVILDYSKAEQFFREKVIEIANFVNDKITVFRSTRGCALKLEDFRAKFLQDKNLEETVFLSVFNLMRLKRMLENQKAITQNQFSPMLLANNLFVLCLGIDNTLKNKNSSKWKFIDHLEFLSSKAGLSLDKNKLVEINSEFQKDFEATLKALLTGTFTFSDKTNPNPKETDLAIAYGFRNMGAHKIESYPVISQQFEELSQRILNTLFISVETLY